MSRSQLGGPSVHASSAGFFGRYDPSDLGLSLAIGLTALLPRLYTAIAWPREPVWDGHYYEFAARRITAGFGYSDGVERWHPWCHWPVGYSGLLAAVYTVFGSGPRTATIANAIVGTLLAIAVHRFARYELNRLRAAVAGLLCALYPGLIAYAALVMTEPVAGLATVLSGWVFCFFRNRKTWVGAALGGFVLGLGTLVSPNLILFAPMLAFLSTDWREQGPGLRAQAAGLLRLGAVATACAVLPVVPWTLRNCRVMDRCAFVSTNGGWNLAIGAFPRATGRFETLRSTDGCAVVTGQVQQDDCWRRLAFHFIAEDPKRWLSLIPKKLSYTFDHESFPVEYLHEADPDRWPENRRASGRMLLTNSHRLLLTAAAFGLVVKRWRSRNELAFRLLAALATAALSLYLWTTDQGPFYWLALMIATMGVWPLPCRSVRAPVLFWATATLIGAIATRAVFFGEDRYHIVVTPMLCILAAGWLRRDREGPAAADSLHRAEHPGMDAWAPASR